MTRENASRIKDIIKARNYKTYFNSKTGELRVRVHSYINNKSDGTDMEQQNCIVKLLNTLSANELRPNYRIESKTYQGFIHDTLVVFS